MYSNWTQQQYVVTLLKPVIFHEQRVSTRNAEIIHLHEVNLKSYYPNHKPYGSNRNPNRNPYNMAGREREIALTMLVTGLVPGNTLASDRGNLKPPSDEEVMAQLRFNQSYHRVHLGVGWAGISIDDLCVCADI